MRLFRLLVAVALLGPTTALRAQYRLPPDSAVRPILEQQVTAKHTAGIVVGLLDADGRRRVLSAGTSGDPAVPLDANTVFEIGSITKTFTNALLADMVWHHEVRLDQPVQQLLPSTVRVPTRNGTPITLLDLATASSGLPRMPSNFKPRDASNPYADYDAAQMYEFLNGYALPRDPGTQYEYSNLGMGLLGHALGLSSGSYYGALRRHVLAPLGMIETVIELTPELRRRLALGHDATGRVVSNWDIAALAGAGALRSTLNDMFRYLAANLDSTSKPLGPVLTMTHVPRRPAGSAAMQIGLGWHVLKSPGGSIVWHNGGTGGYRTFIGFDLTKRVGVIVLTNSSVGADDVGFHLIDPGIPLSKPPVERTEIPVDATTLQRYVGVYQLAPRVAVTVTLDNGGLWVQATDQPKLQVFAYAPDEFFLKEDDVQVTFVKDSAGVVTSLIVHQGGAHQPARKVR